MLFWRLFPDMCFTDVEMTRTTCLRDPWFSDIFSNAKLCDPLLSVGKIICCWDISHNCQSSIENKVSRANGGKNRNI